MRAFVALPLPGVVHDPLAALLPRIPVGRAVAVENLHLTLAFLDEIGETQAMAAHMALAGLVAAPVTLTITRLDVFGGKRPRLLHAAATGPEGLQTKLVRALRDTGIALERRKFRPHITLARLPYRMTSGEEARLARFLGEAAALTLPPAPVDRFALYRSTLHPDGPVYEVLADYPLIG